MLLSVETQKDMVSQITLFIKSKPLMKIVPFSHISDAHEDSPSIYLIIITEIMFCPST